VAFTPKITRARYVYSSASAEQMAGLGATVLGSVADRIKRGVNCEDAPAKPLKPGRNGKKGYPDYKAQRGIAAIRNWISPNPWPRGRVKTLRALNVKTANENRVVIGFIDPKADQIAHINNQREKQFGVSPKDREVLTGAVEEIKRSSLGIKKTA
jgi:hypothetical protein